MSEWPWRSPEATRRALTDRINGRFPPDERSRRQREIAYRRLMHRLFSSQPDRWVVKGGAALLLRLDPNRSSNDIDLAYVHEAGEHALALAALRDAAGLDLGDFFSFEIGGGRLLDEDHPLEREFAVSVIARLGASEFARFSVDLALPRTDLSTERVDEQTTLTGVAAVDEVPALTVLALPAQVADKICALYERHGSERRFSSRARDLADIAMIAAQEPLDGTSCVEALAIEQERRLAARTLEGPLPERLELPADQRADFEARWERATRGAPLAFDEAYRTAELLLGPLLAGEVQRRGWSPNSRSWEAV